MNSSHYRILIAIAVCMATLVVTSGTAVAATTVYCEPVFTGSVKAQSAARCVPDKRVSRGPRGLRGARGLRGRTGAVGAMGPVGAQGVPGLAGLAGADGAAGPQGLQGIPGVAGPAGPQGATGPAGLTGATGAAGTNGLAEYAYVYNLTTTVVAIGADVPLDSNGVVTAGITHAPGSPSITLTNAGDYKVTFSVSGTEPNQMALFNNGVVVPGTIYGSGAGTQQNTGYVIVTVGAGDVLTLRNHSSPAAVTLSTVVGGTEANVNASISIEKLG